MQRQRRRRPMHRRRKSAHGGERQKFCRGSPTSLFFFPSFVLWVVPVRIFKYVQGAVAEGDPQHIMVFGTFLQKMAAGSLTRWTYVCVRNVGSFLFLPSFSIAWLVGLMRALIAEVGPLSSERSHPLGASIEALITYQERIHNGRKQEQH